MTTDHRTAYQRKRVHERAVRVNITLPPALFGYCSTIVQKHGFSGISDYLAASIRRDAGLDLNANEAKNQPLA